MKNNTKQFIQIVCIFIFRMPSQPQKKYNNLTSVFILP